MIAALLCATLLAQSQDAPRFSIEQRAQRADLAFEAMGEIYGVELEVIGELKDEIVFVYLPNATFEEFRAKTAAGLYAEWSESEDGWVLERGESGSNALMQEFLDDRRKETELELTNFRPAPLIGEVEIEFITDKLVDPVFTELIWMELNGYDLQLGRRAINRIISKFDPVFIADLEIGRKYVWAFGDSLYQSLPALDEAVDMYKNEAEQFRQLFKKTSAKEKLSLYARADIPDPFRLIFGVSEPVKTVYLTVRPEVKITKIQLLAFDEHGKEAFSDVVNISNYNNFGSLATYGRDLVPFKRRPDALNLLESLYVSNSRSGNLFPKYIAGMPKLELHGLDASDTLISLGKQKGRPVVASFSDEQLKDSMGVWYDYDLDEDAPSPKIDPVSSLKWMSKYHRLLEKNGAYILNPRIPRKYRRRLDRDATSNYARAVKDSDKVDLPLFLNVIKQSDSKGEISLALIALLGHPDNARWWEFSEEVAVPLFLLAGMNDAQMKQAHTPRGIRFTSQQIGEDFSQMMRESLTDADIWEDFINDFGYDLDEDENRPIYAATSIDQITFGLAQESILRAAVIDLWLNHSQQIVAVMKTAFGPNSFELDKAADYYTKSLKRSSEEGARTLESLRYRLEVSVSVDAVLRIGGRRISITETIELGYESSPSYRLNEMPADIQKSFWDEVKRIQDGDGGGQNWRTVPIEMDYRKPA